MIAKAQVLATAMPPLTSDLPFIPEPILLFHRIWPVAGLTAAVIVDVIWMGFLGYASFRLVEQSYF